MHVGIFNIPWGTYEVVLNYFQKMMYVSFLWIWEKPIKNLWFYFHYILLCFWGFPFALISHNTVRIQTADSSGIQMIHFCSIIKWSINWTAICLVYYQKCLMLKVVWSSNQFLSQIKIRSSLLKKQSFYFFVINFSKWYYSLQALS